MNKLIINIIFVIVAFIIGALVNFGTILIGMKLIPMPDGVTMENLRENIHLFEPRHYITPFLHMHLGHCWVLMELLKLFRKKNLNMP
jgi:hypothetical protein